MTRRIGTYLRNNVLGLIALFIALGLGSAWAATKLSKNSVGSKQIKNGQIKNADLDDDAVTSPKVADGSLLRADFASGELPAGPQGPAGRSALEVLRSGETIRGAFALTNTVAGTELSGVTFPIPAPQEVDSHHVVAAGQDTAPGDGCTGTAAAPVAGPGFVCIYLAGSPGITATRGFGARSNTSSASATGDGSPFGFVVAAQGGASSVATGTWAYKAP